MASEKNETNKKSAASTPANRTAAAATEDATAAPVATSTPAAASARRTGTKGQKQLVWTTPRKQALVQTVRETRGDVPRVIAALTTHPAFSSDEAAVARLGKKDAPQLIRTQFNKLVKAAKKEGIDETTLPTLQSNRGKGSQASIREIFSV